MLTHAQATEVTVTVSDRDRVATLDVVDNGTGFDPAQAGRAVKEGHFGLQGLTDLVKDAGGTFAVTPSPGAGTHVHVEVPLS